MANDQAKRSLLDQLTDSATATPSVPPALTPTPTADASAALPGSTANLESIAASPDTLNANVEATKQTEAPEDHPSFLKKLARAAAGFTGLSDPNSSPQANLGARIGALAGRTGNALAEAAGTPEQKQLAEERNQLPVKMAQIQNEREYRQGLLGTKNQANDIAEMKAEQQQQQAAGKMRLKGYVPDEKTPGAYRPMNEDEIISDPILSQNRDLMASAIAAKNAGAALSAARFDALMNPNNPTLQIKMKQIEAQLKLAQQRLGMQMHSQARQDFQDLQNYGLDSNGRTLNSSNAGPFMAADEQGNPIPNKQATPFRPTTAARGKGEQASTIIDAGEQLVHHIQENSDQIGPLASRYGNLTSFIGNPPPEYRELAAELASWIALHPAAHGFRGLNAVQEFEKAFGPIAMTPEALIAGIRGSYNTMGALQRTATPKTTGPARNSRTTVPNMSTPQNDVVEYIRGADGKLHPKGQ